MPKMQRMHGLGENGGGGGGVVQTQREWVLVVVEVEIDNMYVRRPVNTNTPGPCIAARRAQRRDAGSGAPCHRWWWTVFWHGADTGSNFCAAKISLPAASARCAVPCAVYPACPQLPQTHPLAQWCAAPHFPLSAPRPITARDAEMQATHSPKRVTDSSILPLFGPLCLTASLALASPPSVLCLAPSRVDGRPAARLVPPHVVHLPILTR